MQAGGFVTRRRRSHTRPRPRRTAARPAARTRRRAAAFATSAAPTPALRPALGRDGVQVFQMALADGPRPRTELQRFHHNSPLDTSGRPFVTMKPRRPAARAAAPRARRPGRELVVHLALVHGHGDVQHDLRAVRALHGQHAPRAVALVRQIQHRAGKALGPLERAHGIAVRHRVPRAQPGIAARGQARQRLQHADGPVRGLVRVGGRAGGRHGPAGRQVAKQLGAAQIVVLFAAVGQIVERHRQRRHAACVQHIVGLCGQRLHHADVEVEKFADKLVPHVRPAPGERFVHPALDVPGPGRDGRRHLAASYFAVAQHLAAAGVVSRFL